MHPAFRFQRRILLGSLALLFLPILPVRAQTDMVTTLGEFVQTNYAVNKCSKPSAELLSRYLQNFKRVTQLATREMQTKQPAKSKQQIYATFQQATDNVTHAMDEVLKREGCQAPSIQNLLKLYETQANADFSHETVK